MPKRNNISMSVIRRLPRYHRFLRHLRNKGVTRISSTELSAKLGLTASQIRQDLNCFGGFGQQGYGYLVDQLSDEIAKILGLRNEYKAILIGAGNLGQAIASHMNFTEDGFSLVAIFDNSPFKIGNRINGIEVLEMEQLEPFCEREKPVMAVLCVPREAVEELSDRLCALGIHSFWNFTHCDIVVKHPDAIVENVHLNDSLMTLCYQIQAHDEKEEEPES